MVSFNFKPEFVPKIQSGAKCSTIRKTQRCNVGDKMQFFTGLRTKNCKRVGAAVCVGVSKIIICEQDIWRLEKPQGTVIDRNKHLHQLEGFQNVADMLAFFRNHYGLPFTGYIHRWGTV